MSEFKMKTVKKGETDSWLSPPKAVYPLIPYLKKFKTIWCPFDLESSAFVQVLREHGFNVLYSHIYIQDKTSLSMSQKKITMQ